MQIYQNAGRARLTERAILLLDRLSVSSCEIRGKSILSAFAPSWCPSGQNSFLFSARSSFFFSVRSVSSCENFCVNSLPLVAALLPCASVHSFQRIQFPFCCVGAKQLSDQWTMSCASPLLPLALRRCFFGYRLNSSKSFFKKSCDCLRLYTTV